jgi:hypothetical protein
VIGQYNWQRFFEVWIFYCANIAKLLLNKIYFNNVDYPFNVDNLQDFFNFEIHYLKFILHFVVQIKFRTSEKIKIYILKLRKLSLSCWRQFAFVKKYQKRRLFFIFCIVVEKNECYSRRSLVCAYKKECKPCLKCKYFVLCCR